MHIFPEQGVVILVSIRDYEESKRLIFRYDRKIPDYFSVVGAPSQFTYV